MTLSTVTDRSEHAGNGSTFEFPTEFKFFNNNDVVVVLRVDATGVEAAWTEGSQYELTGETLDDGGTVTVNTTPTDYTPQIGETLIVYRDLANVQESSLPLGGAFPSTTVEQMADYAAMRDQQLADGVGRSLRFPVSDSDSLDAELPNSVDRADTFLAFDADGNPIAAAGTSADLTPVSAFMDDLLDDADAATARNTLGIYQVNNAVQYGAVGDGIADDTAALQAALDAGGAVLLESGATYKITSTLFVSSNGGLVGDGTPTIYMPAASFTNTDLEPPGSFGATAVGIDCSGLTAGPYTANDNIILDGFILESEVSDGRMLRGINASNVTDFRCRNIEMFGFPVARGICVSGILGDSVIENNWIHDFTDDTNWGGGTFPQITAIEVDNLNYLVNGITSTHLRILNNRIKDITVGATFLAAHGYQSDGINVPNYDTAFLTIAGNHIEGTGEGIDHFGQFSSITGNVVIGSYQFGIKLIHGARNNAVVGNTVYLAGHTGIGLFGSSDFVGDTQQNLISGNNIAGINYNAAWGASPNACISIEDNGGATGLPRENLIIGNFLNPAGGKWAINITTNGTNNQFRENFEIAGVSGYVTGTGTGRIVPAKPTRIRAYRGTAQTIANGAPAKVQFNTETFDDRAEFDAVTNFRFTCQIPGIYNVSAYIRYGTVGGGTTISAYIYKNNSQVSSSQVRYDETADTSVSINDDIVLVEGDYVEIFTEHTDGGGLDITHGSGQSRVCIKHVY